MKTPEQILSEIWQCREDELQLYVTLNPDVYKIIVAMNTFANQQVEQALKDAGKWTDDDMRKSYSEGERFGSQEVLLGESLINESDTDAKEFEPFLEELKQSKTL